ncbi:MAG: hypothetical protein MRJ96_15255 [Nitrospirales bacterium]|nr:hypothetical protein [Nitrospira sp.]MDR4502800.1 hypothetical protein [Nitrospirales bacterium]
MMFKTLSISLLIICSSVLLCSSVVLGTMGGVTQGGPLFTQGGSSTAVREFVKLEKSGNVLVARPQHAFVKMITVYAPGLSEGHLILRELLTRDGRQTLLLTAPDEIQSRVQRATLYTAGLHESLVLLENVKGVWEKHFSQELAVDQHWSGAEQAETFRIFSVRHLGFYWLVNPSLVDSVVSHSPQVTSARTLMGGEISWGLLPSLLGIACFILLGALSRYIHKTSRLHEW